MKSRTRAEPVYSKIQSPGRFLLTGIYRRLENLGPRAEPVYSKIQGIGRLLVPSVYSLLEEAGPGQNLYTQKFRAQADSWSIAYTESPKKLVPGRISILKKSESRQAPCS